MMKKLSLTNSDHGMIDGHSELLVRPFVLPAHHISMIPPKCHLSIASLVSRDSREEDLDTKFRHYPNISDFIVKRDTIVWLYKDYPDGITGSRGVESYEGELKDKQWRGKEWKI